MAGDHEDGDHRCPHQLGGRPTGEGQPRNDKEHCHYGGNGRRLPHQNHDEPYNTDDQSNSWGEVDESANRRCDALATPEPMPDRERVADHCSEQRHVSELGIDGENADGCRSRTLEAITDEYDCCEPLPERSQNVGGAWIAGTDCADVDARSRSDDDAEVDATEQI